jgi:DNA-binding MarR family transcriptional regulator
LLSKALLAFAVEFEREANLSLAITGNVLRVLDEKAVRLRDLPLLTGVSKEAISMALGILQKRGLAVPEAEPSGAHGKTIRLTAKGLMAQKGSRYLLRTTEERWRSRFGERTIEDLREVLEKLVGDASPEQSPLFRGLEPYPDGWRASVRKPKALPHFPMVLHRGGFPDGS